VPSSVLARRILTLGLIAWLVWRGSAATFLLVKVLVTPQIGQLRSALSSSEEERIVATLSVRDAERGLPSGYSPGLYRTLLEKVGPGDVVLAHNLGDRQATQVLAPLPALLFPRSIRTDRLPVPEHPTPLAHVFVLDFRDRFRDRLEKSLTLVASGHDWALWH